MDVSSLGLLEPKAVPGIEKTLTELLIIFSVIIGLGLVVTISSIVPFFGNPLNGFNPL